MEKKFRTIIDAVPAECPSWQVWNGATGATGGQLVARFLSGLLTNVAEMLPDLPGGTLLWLGALLY